MTHFLHQTAYSSILYLYKVLYERVLGHHFQLVTIHPNTNTKPHGNTAQKNYPNHRSTNSLLVLSPLNILLFVINYIILSTIFFILLYFIVLLLRMLRILIHARYAIYKYCTTYEHKQSFLNKKHTLYTYSKYASVIPNDILCT